MRKLLLVCILICATITSCNPVGAQNGLVANRRLLAKQAPPSFPSGSLFYLRDAINNYVPGIDGVTAAWTDPDTGISATQSVHLQKPVVSGKGINFSSVSADSRLSFPSITMLPYIPPSSGTMMVCVRHGSLDSNKYFLSFYAAGLYQPLIGTVGNRCRWYDYYSGIYDSDAIIASGELHVYAYRDNGNGNALSGQFFDNDVLSATTYRQAWGSEDRTIGNLKVGGYAYTGILYAIAHWNRYLTDTEIKNVTAIWQGAYQ